MSNTEFVCEGPLARCESCGIIDETRPYGKNNEEICYDCGLKDPKTTAEKMAEEIIMSLGLGPNKFKGF